MNVGQRKNKPMDRSGNNFQIKTTSKYVAVE